MGGQVAACRQGVGDTEGDVARRAADGTQHALEAGEPLREPVAGDGEGEGGDVRERGRRTRRVGGGDAVGERQGDGSVRVDAGAAGSQREGVHAWRERAEEGRELGHGAHDGDDQVVGELVQNLQG